MIDGIAEAFHKGGWGMWPILVALIVTVAIMVERAVYLYQASVDKDKLLALLKSTVMSGNVQGAIKV
jgi:biopolymer transport protein ExbB/TolQ